MRGLLCAPLLLALSALPASAPARAEGPAPAAATRPAEPQDRITSAYHLLEADRPREAMALLRPLREELEDGGDPQALLLVYDLMGYAGQQLKDARSEVQGNAHAVLLNMLGAPLDATDTLTAELTLADTYRRHDLPTAQFYVLANVLAAVEAARRAAPLGEEMEKLEAAAATLMGQNLSGQNLIGETRPELALSFFLRAQALARQGRMDAGNAAKLDAVIATTQARIATQADPPRPGPEDCVGHPGLSPEQMKACRAAADHAAAQGDAAGAERILLPLLRDVQPDTLRSERYEAARDLLLLRLLHREARDPELVTSAALVANYLASINEVTTAALISARLARAAIDAGVFDDQVARLCGHVARRAARSGSPLLARRMLALQRRTLLAGLEKAQGPLTAGPPPLQERRLAATLLQIEGAQIAAMAGYGQAAAAERDDVERQLALVDLKALERIEELTVVRHAGQKDFIFPSYVAAVELVGRLAARLPATDPRHDSARIHWISAVETWWSDHARATALAAEAAADIRAAPQGRADALAQVLMMSSSLVELSDPAASLSYTRQAYEILASQPRRESERIDLLLDMAGEQSDERLALALVAEAGKLRQLAQQSARPVEPRTAARLDLKRAVQAFDAGDTTQAVQLGEAAVAGLIAAGLGRNWVIVEPARKLASLYAALGRMEDARKTYDTYVFALSHAAVDGEAAVIADQLGLATLEAYYAPEPTTVQTLASLLDRAHRRLQADRDLPRRILRAQAFAYHGLGEGPQARDAARQALRSDRPPASDTTRAEEDRKLLETLVGADWQASGQGHP